MSIIAKVEDGAPENSTRLTKLISDAPTRERCIDRVAHHLADIHEARRRKITWDAIAEAMMMNRGTLINAVKKLTAQGNVKTKLVLPTTPNPTSSYSSITNNEVMHSPQTSSLITDATHPNVGMTTLGRTKIENFNL